MKLSRYTLEIYEPGSHDNVVGYYESLGPFGAISVGDYLHPFAGSLEETWPELGPHKYLRATEVHHVLSAPEGQDEITHKVMVYTEVHEL
jgi:hypothetical protein